MGDLIKTQHFTSNYNVILNNIDFKPDNAIDPFAGDKDLVKYLKKISRYPEGQRLAQEISDSWKREYKKRSAMIDELNRAGF